MFAMLSGAWPRSTDDDPDVDAMVRGVVAAQAQAGLGFVTDGHVRWADPAAALLTAIEAGDTGPDGMLLRAWTATAAEASAVGLPAVQAMVGPYSLGGLEGRGPVPAGSGRVPAEREARAARTLRLAATLAGEVAALAAAGCPVVIVEEPAAAEVGEDPSERALFAEAQRQLLSAVETFPDLHAMLAISGGNADAAGPEAIFAAPYRSYLFDLVAGPDNWRLVRAAPADRGIVCAAMLVEATGGEDQVPLLVWAARYAASAGGRGLDRVGLANGTPVGGLDPAVARAALETLGRAAGLAVMPLDRAVQAGLDPRTVGSRMAALGPSAPRPPRSRRRRALP